MMIVAMLAGALIALPPDKQQHFEVEAKIGLLFGTIFFLPPTEEISTSKRWLYSGAVCLTPGVAKEVLDATTHEADPLDMVANLAGCAVGVSAGAVLGTSIRIVGNKVVITF